MNILKGYFNVARFFLILPVLGIALVADTYFPFIVVKSVWFRGTVDLALIIFLLGLWFSSDAKIYEERLRVLFRSPLVLAVTLFTASFLLACLFSFDPAMSFWSNFERSEGGVQILHLYLFFLLAVILFSDETHWQIIFNWALVGGGLMALYGLFAGFGFKGFLGPKFGAEGFRFAGSIGNPAYTASYCLFLLFYSLYLLTNITKGKIVSMKGVMILGGVLLFLITFWAAATRGSFIGLIAAISAFSTYFAYAHHNWRKWLWMGIVTLLLAVSTLVYLRDLPVVKSLPGVRLLDLSLTTQTLSDRIMVWQIAWAGFKERPFFGWGPENFDQAFYRHYVPELWVKGGEKSWYDRAHSVYFDYLVSTGILGLLSYLSIFTVFFWQLFRNRRQTATNSQTRGKPGRARKTLVADYKSTITQGLLIAVIVAYLVQGIVLFDTFPIHLNLFLILAFACNRFQTQNEKSPKLN